MTDENEIDLGQIPPSILVSLRSNQFTWNMVLGELCDNSIDADATRIDIEFGPKSLILTDDGNGCDNIEKMLTIGSHYKHKSTRLGRYGVGLKDAACWLWGSLAIKTTSGGMLRSARVDWESLSKSPSWKLPAPPAVQTASKPGTQLAFSGITKRLPDAEDIAEELGYTFAPAILWGRQIRIARPRKPAVLVKAWQMPDLSNQVNERFEINGKRVHLVAGIVGDGELNERSGFSVCHEHRIICNTSFGSGGYSTARICGTLTLDAAWSLSRNKTELVDESSEDLQAAVFYYCEDILKQSAVHARELRNTALESSVTDKLRSMLGAGSGVKEKRDPPTNATGTVDPKGTGKKRTPRKTQPGNRLASQLAGRVRMEWRPRTDGLMGSVDIPGAVIYLNSEHPRLAYHLRSENDDALADACVTLITFEEMNREERSKLFRDFTGFVEALSNVMTAQQETAQMQEAAR